MPISFNKQLTFIHIPKCGGTSISKAIGAGGTNSLYSQKTVAQLIKGRIRINPQHGLTDEQWTNAASKTPQHLTAYELYRLFPDSPQTMFTVVRNPFDRLVSEYSFVLQEIAYTKDLRYINVRKGFEHFVNWGLALPRSQRISIFDGHLEPQTDYIMDPNSGNQLVTTVFYVEDMDPCISFINQHHNEPVHLGHEKKSLHGHYSTYYTQPLIDVVSRFYRQDLDRFSYTFQTV